jgi:hypothetical protein
MPMHWSFAVAVVACTPVTPVAPMTPRPEPKLVAFAQPVHVKPTDDPVARYGEPLPPPDLTELDTAVIAATHAIVSADDKLQVDNELSSIPVEIAVALRAGGDRYQLDLILYARSRQIYRYGKYYFSVVTTVDPDKVDPMSLLTHQQIDHLGVGVAQGYSPKLGDNALWIVTVLALRKT